MRGRRRGDRDRDRDWGACGAIGSGIGIVGDCGVGLSAPVPASVLTVNETNGIASLMTQSPVPASVLTVNETNGIASLMTQSPVPASVPVPIENETNGMLSPMTPSPMTPSLVYKPILSYFFISPISILETLSSNFSTGVIFSLVK